MNINQQRNWIETKVNERGYNHNNLRYHILMDGRSPYEVRIDYLKNGTYQVSNTDERANLLEFKGSQRVYSSFNDAVTEFLKRLDLKVEINRRAMDPSSILVPEYSSPLWDK